MAGKLYGVGVGPGDPELLTLKALRLVKEAEVIALPGQVPEDTVAFKIVEGAYPELGKKELLAVPFPMSKDPEVLKSYHDAGADKVKAVLDQGKDVVFLTLGDPTVYSTYLYIHHRLVAQGYETEIVCGITSFCAVSARLNTGLVAQRGETIDPGPDSNFSIWSAGGYIFGYDEIDTTMEVEETPEAREATIAWETRQLGIMDWITNDVDWMTKEVHPSSVRLAWHN